MIQDNRSSKGFTLLEILVALLIFSILSMILASALRNVINADLGTAKSAYRLRELQMALLMLERDITQTVDRPILNTTGDKDPAFIGTPRYFTLTHTGFANPTSEWRHSSLERTQYAWSDGVLWRKTWVQLDQPPQSSPAIRPLLEGAMDATFQYLDREGHFQNNWPPSEGQENPLPRAIKISITIPNWGKLSQLYVIYAQPNPNEVEPSQPFDR